MIDTASPSDRVYVWDRFVRIFHWSLVGAFTVAFATGEGPELLHLIAGFAVAGLLLARLIWGFIGPPHARFTDFAYPPRRILGYLRDLVLLRSRRYLGHSPAGGAMIFLLLAVLAATSVSGVLLLGAQEGWGPEGPAVQTAAVVTVAAEDEGESPLVESLEEVHEGLAEFTLLLVMLHVCGVAVASFAHRENLPAAMLTGFKRP